MLEGLAGVLGSTEEEGVGTGGGAGGDLVDGQGLAAGLDDACAGRRGEAERSDGELGELEEAVVVSDGADLIRCQYVPIASIVVRRTMTMVLPSCALAEYLLAAVATILDKLTAAVGSVCACAVRCEAGVLTRAVGLGHHEASQDRLVEGGIGAAYCCQRTRCAESVRDTYEPGTCKDAPTA